MRPKLVAANWKMNGSSQHVTEYAETFVPPADASRVQAVIFPPAVYLVPPLSCMSLPAGYQDLQC